MANLGPLMVTDKIAAGFLPTYLEIARILGDKARVLELGIYGGASLRMWAHLFPNGQVTGVDNRIHPEADTSGARQVIMNAHDPVLPGILHGPFDLIVDDASHQGEQTRESFEMLWPLLAPGGFYVVEDWFVGLPEFKSIPDYNPEMLEFVQGLICRLSSRGSEAESVQFRFGLAIVRKRGA